MHTLYSVLRSRSALFGRLAVLLILFAGATSIGLGKVELTDAVGKSEKRRNASTGKDEVWVVITYKITDVPAEGSVVKMEATMTPQNGGAAFAIEPIAAEVSGALGGITTDGDKTIEWKAEQSLIRMSKQGKYNCVVKLEVEGKEGATRATLTIGSYKPSSWEYFQKEPQAVITDLERVGSFPPAGCQVRGGNWHTTVEAGAVFYKGTVTKIPRWRGRRNNDVITGATDESACSAFLAIKGQGTPGQKMWINFARHFDGLLRVNQTTSEVDWEFQFRYTQSGATKTLQAGNAGDANDNSFVLWNEGQDFTLDLDAAPEAEAETNTFKVEVLRREYRYSYKGVPTMLFTTVDDGYFDTPGGNMLVLTDGDMKINDWMHFSGDFSLDTTTDNATFTSTGSWSNAKGEVLWTGPFNAKLTTDIEGNIGVIAPPQLTEKFKIGGFSLTFEKIHFVGGVDKATGVEFDIRLLVRQLSSGCRFDMNNPGQPGGASTAGFKLNKVKMTDEGWDLGGVEAQNVGIAIAPAFCLKSFKANYDRPKDSLFAELIVKGPIFDDIGGSFALVKGEVDAFRIIMKLAGGGLAVPIPFPPAPANMAEWRGFDASVSNITNGPYTLEGKVMFANNSAWKALPGYKLVVGILKAFDLNDIQLFEYDMTAKYVHGQSFTASALYRQFSLIKDVWLIQGTASAVIQMNPANVSYTQTGTTSILNLGGNNQWFFTGSGTEGVTIHPEFMLSASLKGEVFIPQLFRNSPGFMAINDWFKLPWKIGGLELAMNNLAVSFNAEIPRYGRANVTVDLAKAYSDPTGFIRISNAGPVSSTRLADKRGTTPFAAADTTWHQFAVTADMERLFVQNWGKNQTTPAASVLVSPQGTVYSATRADSSVIFYPSSETGQSSMWVVRAPLTGTWKFGVIDRGAGDSTYTWARYRDPARFVISTEQQSRTVTSRWSPSGARPGARVDLFIDTDTTGLDGLYIGSTDASTGTFQYTMSDSLPHCGYYVYAMRNDSGMLSPAYSATFHSNAKSWLPAPANIQAVANAQGDATITWTASADPKTLAYAIRVTGPDGYDSVYTTRSFHFTMAQIHIENWQNKRISIRTAGEDDLTGCWSEPVGLTLASVDESLTGGTRPQGIEIHVVPQPATAVTSVYANIMKRTSLLIELYDVDGTRISTLSQGVFDPGTVRAELDASTLSNGVYFVRFTGEGINASRKIVVQK